MRYSRMHLIAVAAVMAVALVLMSLGPAAADDNKRLRNGAYIGAGAGLLFGGGVGGILKGAALGGAVGLGTGHGSKARHARHGARTGAMVGAGAGLLFGGGLKNVLGGAVIGGSAGALYNGTKAHH